MSRDRIFVKGAKEHNLKNIDIEIPRDKLVVLTGLSGSGKSSLAFDTIYAEGQRRYVESLSAYARQFLGQMEKPDVEYIEGLSPAISIDQKTTSKNPRSTVGTVTEIYDYLRLLYARIGKPHCPKCGKAITQQTIDQMVDIIMSLDNGTRIQVLSPVVRGRKGEHTKFLQDMGKQGYVRARVDGETIELSQEIKLDKNKKHNIEIIIDRLMVKEQIQKRLADSLETALALAEGIALVEIIGEKEIMFSQNLACIECGVSIEELSPRMFSFNSPYGACGKCDGLGFHLKVDKDLVLPDKGKSISEGAVAPWSNAHSTWYVQVVESIGRYYGFDIHTPISGFTEEQLDILLYGTKGVKHSITYIKDDRTYQFNTTYEGIINNLERRFRETKSEYMRSEIQGFMAQTPCTECDGTRLRVEARSVLVEGKPIHYVTSLSITESDRFFNNLNLSQKDTIIARQILKEIRERLGFMINVGLDYLTLDRASGTLSGGESQRIRLATQIGSKLVGVLYILDEPSIGLHQRDNDRLLKTLKELRDLGNTLLVVEHDEDTIYSADHIIDIGPGAGANGGLVVAQGTIDDIINCPESVTGQYLSGKKYIPVPTNRRKPNGKWIEIIGAKENNLKEIDVKFPMGVFTCITGVSGSGKSTLVNEILYKALAQQLNGSRNKPGEHKILKGAEHLDKIIEIDQSPIGRTPRSNPATYTGVFDIIREVYTQTTEAKMRGYKNGRFSFNVKGGRCEACKGDGIIKIEMHFLPDVYVPCEVCKGKRYNRETLEVKYKGKNISDVLDMTVEEASEFFTNIPRINNKIQTLMDVGLGYIKLGQPSTTLSGGEAQRVKLATELSKRSTGRTLYILDEPTTGLHMADIHKLLIMLSRLAEGGNTIIVIEHNLEVIKTADYIIDLGPEGGDKGGTILATGTPEEVSADEGSYTGRYLKAVMERSIKTDSRELNAGM